MLSRVRVRSLRTSLPLPDRLRPTRPTHGIGHFVVGRRFRLPQEETLLPQLQKDPAALLQRA